MIKNLNDTLDSAMAIQHSAISNCLIEELRENAKPKLSGPITSGKLRWRGIRRCVDHATSEVWLEQRGERITDKYPTIPKLEFE